MHAEDCQVNKCLNLLVHLSKDKKMEKYSLDTTDDWQQLIQCYHGELKKKGDEAKAEIDFNPEMVYPFFF